MRLAHPFCRLKALFANRRRKSRLPSRRGFPGARAKPGLARAFAPALERGPQVAPSWTVNGGLKSSRVKKRIFLSAQSHR